jgi:hypothetical protein
LLVATLAALAAWGLGESGVFQFRPVITDRNMMGHAYRDASPQTRETAIWSADISVATAALR